jgi:hypothetical protein
MEAHNSGVFTEMREKVARMAKIHEKIDKNMKASIFLVQYFSVSPIAIRLSEVQCC